MRLPCAPSFAADAGASQRLALASSIGAANWSVPDTRPLHSADPYVSFSGALVAVPLWLMLALLSPLDAYVAAQAIARRA